MSSLQSEALVSLEQELGFLFNLAERHSAFSAQSLALAQAIQDPREDHTLTRLAIESMCVACNDGQSEAGEIVGLESLTERAQAFARKVYELIVAALKKIITWIKDIVKRQRGARELVRRSYQQTLKNIQAYPGTVTLAPYKASREGESSLMAVGDPKGGVVRIGIDSVAMRQLGELCAALAKVYPSVAAKSQAAVKYFESMQSKAQLAQQPSATLMLEGVTKAYQNSVLGAKMRYTGPTPPIFKGETVELEVITQTLGGLVLVQLQRASGSSADKVGSWHWVFQGEAGSVLEVPAFDVGQLRMQVTDGLKALDLFDQLTYNLEKENKLLDELLGQMLIAKSTFKEGSVFDPEVITYVKRLTQAMQDNRLVLMRLISDGYAIFWQHAALLARLSKSEPV